MNKKKYWNGSIRLASDLFWSSTIMSLMLILIDGHASIGVFIFSVLSVFFLFFFWSWNKEHCKSRCARWGIHIICGTFFLVLLFYLGILARFPLATLSSELGWVLLIFFSTPLVLVGLKYKSLIWDRKK